MRLIVVTGMPGAGKEEFLTAGMAAGIPFARMGDAVRELYSGSSAQKEGVPMGQFASSERELHGKDIWAKRTLEKMKNESIFIIDGCRSMDEIRSFKNLGGEVVTVGIYAPPQIRYERLVKRGREDAPADLNAFNERDSRELSWGVGEVLALCDFMVPNTGSLDDFHKRSAELMRSLQ